MNRKLILIVIVLFTVLSLSACAGNGENNKDSKTTGTAITNGSMKTGMIGESTPSAVSSSGINQDFIVKGLGFGSTEDDVIETLGEPVGKVTSAGISIYYYGKGLENGFSDCNSITFINGTISKFRIIDKTWSVSEGDYLNKKYSRDDIALNESDIGITVSQAIRKFGYPDDIYIFSNKYYYFIYLHDGKEDSIRFWGEDPDSVRAKSYTISSGNWTMIDNIKIGDGIDSIFKKIYLPEDIGALGVTLTDTKKVMLKKITKSDNYSYEGFRIAFDYGKDDVIGISTDRYGNTAYIDWNKNEYPGYDIPLQSNAARTHVFDKSSFPSLDDGYLSGCDFDRGRTGVIETFGNPNKALLSLHDKYGCNFTYYYDNFSVYISSPFYGDIESIENGYVTSYQITGDGIAGFRGLEVGDDVNKFLDVVPCNNDIDFNKTGQQHIYNFPETQTIPDGYFENYAGMVESKVSGSGRISYDFFYGYIYCDYIDGKISEIGFQVMRD